MKKMIIFLVLLAMLPVTSFGEVLPDNTYSVWLQVGPDTSLYSTYEQNPGVEYIETLSFGPDERKVHFSFSVPPAGTASDNFNTLIATGSYMDVMDLSSYNGSIVELHADDVAMDLTPYMDEYMPNYMAFLNANPNLKATATNMVDGEPRFLQIRKYEDDVNTMWGGYTYRRDWIVKYGSNPLDGSAFSGSFVPDENDAAGNQNWIDNVVFPSGGSHPFYISDWEWMFDIFTLAIADLGIKDGYSMSLYYPGYMETGDLVTSFGGGNPLWYTNAEGNIGFGATSDNFRTYLQSMSTWYKNGWIDTAFNERTTNMFYEIDMPAIYSGKVGLSYHYQSVFGGQLNDPNNPYLDGYVGYFAPQPINDVYGGEAQQNKTPDSMYQISKEGIGYMVTTSAEKKDIPTLLSALDYMYSYEGGIIQSFGLNAEQYEVTQNAFYQEMGITDGAYEIVTNENGVALYSPLETVNFDPYFSAVRPDRLPGLNLISLRDDSDGLAILAENQDLWTMYPNTGWLSNSFTGQLSLDEISDVRKVETKVKEFLTKNVPAFIKGSRDPYNDEEWNSFVKALNKYKPETVTEIYQNLANNLSFE